MAGGKQDGNKEGRRFVVRGHVQGVGFRNFAMELADRLGLTGYAKNLPEGTSVEVVAEGAGYNLDEFERKLRLGPSGSRVNSLEVSRLDYRGSYKSFEVY